MYDLNKAFDKRKINIPTRNEIIRNYDLDKSYYHTMVGTYIDSIPEEGKTTRNINFIKETFFYSVYEELSIEEKEVFNTLYSNLKKMKVASESSNDFGSGVLKTRDFKIAYEEFKKAGYVKEADSETIYKLRTKRPVLNNIFFKTEVIDKSKDEDLDSNNKIVDSDYENYMYKTWIFTNADPKHATIHSIDRNNRIGLVQYKDDMKEDIFNVIGVPKDAKGIFIIKENVLARPEFEDILGMNKNGLVIESSRANRNIVNLATKLDYMDSKEEHEFKIPLIEPIPAHRGNQDFRNKYFDTSNLSILVGKETFKGHLPKTLYGKVGLDKYVPERTEYSNMFNSGVETLYTRKIKEDDFIKMVVDRWTSIVDAYYDNDNIKLQLDNNDRAYRNKFNLLLRKDIGNLTNYIIREPHTDKEAKMFIFKRDNIDLYHYGTNSNPSDVYRKRVKANIPIPAVPLPYSVLNNHYISIRDEQFTGYKSFSQQGISNKLENIIRKLNKEMVSKNGISFQDIIFIPIEKLENNDGCYYNEKSDFLFTINNIRNSKHLDHPYNKPKIENNKIKKGVSISIQTDNRHILDRVYYTNTYGMIKTIHPEYIENSDSVIVISEYDNYKEETQNYPLTEENLKLCGVYTSREDAECFGYKEEHLKNLKYNVDKLSIENKLEISKINLDLTKHKYTMEVNASVRKTFENITEYKINMTRNAHKHEQELLMLKEKYRQDYELFKLKSKSAKETEDIKLQKANIDKKVTMIKSIHDALNFVIRVAETVISLKGV